MTETNTETDTDTDDLPRVVIRRSWIVLTFCKDDDGDYGVDDEEFIDQAEALATPLSKPTNMASASPTAMSLDASMICATVSA